MKVFISWSGSRSRAVAEILRDWLKCVIQASKPWISSRDLDRGALWFTAINDQLKDTTVGIICLTQDNKEKPWVLFEAGALAKGLSSNRVCTLLIDLQHSEVQDPLAQFNHTLPNKEQMQSLVATINAVLGDSTLDERTLTQVFETYWPQFAAKFEEALKNHPPTEAAKPLPPETVMAEILSSTRYLQSRMRLMEERLNKPSRGFTEADVIRAISRALTDTSHDDRRAFMANVSDMLKGKFSVTESLSSASSDSASSSSEE